MIDQAEGSQHSRKEVEHKRPISVLIAEDEDLLIPLLEGAFKMAGGFETTVVKTTREALQVLRDSKAANNSTDLVFSDLGLEDNEEGGYEIAKVAKDEGLAEHFILFTGRPPQIKHPQQLENMGINRIIAKPQDYKGLLKSLNEAKEAILKSETPQQ